MHITLEGKVALVTGASRGIGKAVASQLARSGAKVMMVSRKLDQLEAAAADIEASGQEEAGEKGAGETGGGETAVFAANVGDVDAGAAAVAATIERFGGLDILVNNAATNPYFGPSLGVDPSRYDKTFQVNLRGPLFWCQAAWEAALKEKPGVIVNIASVGGMRAEAGLGIYNVTKAALIHLTRQLASELGPTRVVGVAPGLIDTDFSSYLVENFGERLAGQLPLRRLGRPEDVADLVVFLASDSASWITGDTFVIDGGAGVRSIG